MTGKSWKNQKVVRIFGAFFKNLTEEFPHMNAKMWIPILSRLEMHHY